LGEHHGGCKTTREKLIVCDQSHGIGMQEGRLEKHALKSRKRAGGESDLGKTERSIIKLDTPAICTAQTNRRIQLRKGAKSWLFFTNF